ncbi:ABC-F family ATP-binding cassette domain-containing protein [Roseobacter sinensis]|uniref:ATP-binding cassette domain-containing protein n=1 Tax=Roseobacter sinensis TaxID=2931391 RepID=A0ABT3BJK2_9RHOB|nr:ABC-F family ATP-binding cassette domain-containing protein [Roseobacter sp. WL0113]MCV3273753.1 ATP-binding cassette domain-containing protein [Roseobacter sp. WL0113]
MPFVVLANLSWHTPDGTSLFTDLDLVFAARRTGLVGRNGVGKTALLRLIAGEVAPASGTITRAGSIGFLRQNPERCPDGTLADLFNVNDQRAILARAEAGVATPLELADADWTLEARLRAALASMGLNGLPLETPLRLLSGGQRTRAGLAALLFKAPDVLLLDEPTNHLDHAGRSQVIDALRAWQGCVIVASHDRALLAEMDAIVELTSLGASTYGGNYDGYREMKRAELALAEGALARAERALVATDARARLAAERKARTDRHGRRLRTSGSQSKLVLDAAKERSEGSGGAAARRQARRTDEAKAALDVAREALEVLQPLAMNIPKSGLASGRDVLQVENLTFGYENGQPVLQDVSLAIRGPERIAIVGPNGSGKSTLLACVAGQLETRAGQVALHVPAALLDQDMSLLNPNETVQEAFARLDPDASENQRRAVLACFLFRGDDALQEIGTLSGGQRLRVGLACTLGHSLPKQLLVLDEPNNHLDIEALKTLEAALNAYDGAILVVSHDTTFLDRIGVTRSYSL